MIFIYIFEIELKIGGVAKFMVGYSFFDKYFGQFWLVVYKTIPRAG
jgi:hypothetical protein